MGSLPFFDLDCNSLELLILESELDVFHMLDELSVGAVDLITGLLHKDPEQRLSVTEALEHPWIREDEAQYRIDASGASDDVSTDESSR